jgi:hypothetical protein
MGMMQMEEKFLSSGNNELNKIMEQLKKKAAEVV